MSEEREDLFRYLDAKFEGLSARVDRLQATWDAENTVCATERTEFRKRLGLLENWRSGLTAVIAVLGFLLSGIPGWMGKLFAATGVK